MKSARIFRQKGFTLIELLVVIGIIGILAAVVLVAVNPAHQFASARDTQRRSDLYSVTNALYQYAVEHNGVLPTNITTTVAWIGTTAVDLEPILVPTYIAAMPFDPGGTGLVAGDVSNTLYSISLNASGRVVMTSVSELNPLVTLAVTR